ncbi:MAG TPA: hypothetical protein VNJ01_15860 [Bacteriovoracaceae bacterium]|nr:hypothetical protein [Bacteriovoracaceae bacterium]
MNKLFLLILVTTMTIPGCGKKSVITNAIKAETTAEAYGDGTHTVMHWVLPLSDQTITSFDSPLKKISFIASGFAKMFMNVGASMGLGKMQLTLVQPIPDLPSEYLKEIRIKRLFFYIEPKEGPRKQPWYKRIFSGRDDVNFDFLARIAVKLSSQKLENDGSWTPLLAQQEISNKEYDFLKSLFDSRYVEPRAESARELILMKYYEEDKEKFLKRPSGKIFILSVDNPKKAGQSRIFFVDHPKLKGSFKSIHLLNKSLIIELRDDRQVEENFQAVLSEEAEAIERIGVKIIEPCEEKTCLDFNVPKMNLMPVMKRANGIRLDAYLEADKVPDSFQLKGFIEFETKLKLTF